MSTGQYPRTRATREQVAADLERPVDNRTRHDRYAERVARRSNVSTGIMDKLLEAKPTIGRRGK
jgi:hypothetical protein